jgi:hypothetical protein
MGRLVLLAPFLLLLGAACARAAPILPREDVVRLATEAARSGQPELAVLEARLEGAMAELTTLGEADRRLGGVRGPAAYAPGQDGASPVWWVTVRGRFRFAGMAPAGTTKAESLAPRPKHSRRA